MRTHACYMLDGETGSVACVGIHPNDDWADIEFRAAD